MTAGSLRDSLFTTQWYTSRVAVPVKANMLTFSGIILRRSPI